VLLLGVIGVGSTAGRFFLGGLADRLGRQSSRSDPRADFGRHVADRGDSATVMAGNFRERALHNSERELENTVLLLARHFDQQLEDCSSRAARWR
jgi:hypothetical protein